MICASLYVLPKLSGKLSLGIFAAKKSFNFLKKLKYCKLPLVRPRLRGFNRAYKRRGLYRREQQLMAGTGKALRNIVQFTGKWAFNFRGGGGAAYKRQLTVCAKQHVNHVGYYDLLCNWKSLFSLLCFCYFSEIAVLLRTVQSMYFRPISSQLLCFLEMKIERPI